MDHVFQELNALFYETKQLLANTQACRNDADRGLNVNTVAIMEDEPVRKREEWLFEYLADAKNDMDRIADSLQELLDELDDFRDTLEYEDIRNKAVKER